MRKHVLPIVMAMLLLIPSFGVISYADNNTESGQSYTTTQYDDEETTVQRSSSNTGTFKPKADKDSKGFDKEALKGAEPDESTSSNLLKDLKRSFLIMIGTLLICIIAYFVYFKPLNIRHREILRAASDRELADIEHQERIANTAAFDDDDEE